MLTYENGRLSLPIDPNLRVPALSGRQPVSNASRASVGSYAVRTNRFDARERRRRGDWSDLDLPVLLLWAESTIAPDCEDDSCENFF